MTSSINPNNIDSAYPVAGQDNDSQGFRDNFTNIKTNFQFAGTEITDLQNKVVLKAALSGTTLNNNMGDSLLLAAKIQDFSATYVDLGTTSGTVTINYAAGHYQVVAANNNITLAFTNFPAAGNMGLIRVRINIIDNPTLATVTLPSAVTIGTNYLQGFNSTSDTITFNQSGIYEFEFVTIDGGSSISVFDLNRNNDPQFLPSAENLAPDAVVSLTTSASYFTSSASDTGSVLAAGSEGQLKILCAKDLTSGAKTITVTNAAWGGGEQIQFTSAGDSCLLYYIDDQWYCIGNNGATFS